MKKQKQYERRDLQGDDFEILVDSPHWPAGTVFQFITKDWWYGHDCLAEFEEERKRDGCTVLAIYRAYRREDGRTRYSTAAEVRSALKSRRLLTAAREAELAREEEALS